jgi:hypothetical protein
MIGILIRMIKINKNYIILAEKNSIHWAQLKSQKDGDRHSLT